VSLVSSSSFREGDGTVARGHRHVPLLVIFGKLGWARDHNSWTVRCRDENGRLSTVAVRLTFGFVILEGAEFGLVYLSPLQVGRLRGALRDAELELHRAARPAGDGSAVRVDLSYPAIGLGH
jgi:hypothetical protein